MIKKFSLLIFFTLTLFFPAKQSFASHLAGGDFKVTMVSNLTTQSSYDVQLRLYRDDVNGISLHKLL